MNQHPILSPCTKFELNWLRNKKVTINLIFNGTSGKIRELKLEMTSYSDNDYDVTNCFGCFEKLLAYTVFLPSFIVLRHQMAELTWGGGFLAPIQYRVRPDSVQNRVKLNYPFPDIILLKPVHMVRFLLYDSFELGNNLQISEFETGYVQLIASHKWAFMPGFH